ncbi:MAG: hypothetical protein LQ352_004291 [Teloschistes flavicans]|nr:MAG: hypothetical protein LQ352_004291 [Teloschistes flavicans]
MKDANSTQNGVWYFQSGPESSSGRKFAACNMGFWIPNIDGGAGKPPQTADHDQCKAIFGAMVEAADANAMLTQSITTRKSFVIGSSVNLKQNPAKPPSPITLPGGVGTGTFLYVNG